MHIPESVNLVMIFQLEPEILSVHLQLLLLLEVDVRVEFVLFHINIFFYFFLLAVLLTVLIFIKIGLDHLELERRMLLDFLLKSLRRNHLANCLLFRSFKDDHEVLIPHIEVALLTNAMERGGLKLLESISKTFVPIDELTVPHIFFV